MLCDYVLDTFSPCAVGEVPSSESVDFAQHGDSRLLQRLGRSTPGPEEASGLLQWAEAAADAHLEGARPERLPRRLDTWTLAWRRWGGLCAARTPVRVQPGLVVRYRRGRAACAQKLSVLRRGTVKPLEWGSDGHSGGLDACLPLRLVPRGLRGLRPFGRCRYLALQRWRRWERRDEALFGVRQPLGVGCPRRPDWGFNPDVFCRASPSSDGLRHAARRGASVPAAALGLRCVLPADAELPWCPAAARVCCAHPGHGGRRALPARVLSFGHLPVSAPLRRGRRGARVRRLLPWSRRSNTPLPQRRPELHESVVETGGWVLGVWRAGAAVRSHGGTAHQRTDGVPADHERWNHPTEAASAYATVAYAVYWAGICAMVAGALWLFDSLFPQLLVEAAGCFNLLKCTSLQR